MTSDNADPGSWRSLLKQISIRIKKHFKKPADIFDQEAFENLDNPRKEMIRGVFELSSETARDIMIPRVDITALEAGTDLKTLVKIVCDAGHSRVPVFEETIDNLVGILYVKDLLRLLTANSRKKFQLKKILHEPFFVPETMPLDELLLQFKIKKLHIAVVVDEYGGVAGIVTMEDILEEIVGEIHDEFDSEELPEIQRIGKYTYEFDPRMTISDFNEMFGFSIPTENFDTVGGYVFDLFGKIPEKGATVSDGYVTFKIKSISGTVINRIIATIQKPE